MKRLIFSIVTFVFTLHVLAVEPSVVGLQYWFNNDQEYEYIDSLRVDANAIISHTIDASHLPYGLHHLYFRVKDDRGYWSSVVASIFYKQSYPKNDTISPILCEYWIDNMSFTFIPMIGNDLSFTVDASTLSEGMHTLNYRVKDNENMYSPLATYLFYKQSYPKNDTISPILCEYWIDNMSSTFIPMIGNDLSFTVDANSLTDGMHILNYRIQDNEGAYGPLQTWMFYKNSKTASRIAWCKYWWNNHVDKAIVEEIVSDTSTIVFTKELSIPHYAQVDGYSANSIARLHFQFGDDLNHVSPIAWTDISYPDQIAPSSIIEIDTLAQVDENEVALKWYVVNDQENDYNVYYSENDSPFVLWLANTTQNNAIFKKKEGVDYKFTVTARDITGNVERFDTTKYIVITE